MSALTKQQITNIYFAWVERTWLWPWERPVHPSEFEAREQACTPRPIESATTRYLQEPCEWIV